MNFIDKHQVRINIPNIILHIRQAKAPISSSINNNLTMLIFPHKFLLRCCVSIFISFLSVQFPISPHICHLKFLSIFLIFIFLISIITRLLSSCGCFENLYDKWEMIRDFVICFLCNWVMRNYFFRLNLSQSIKNLK